ncbi:DUF4157 domain-containing protein [Nostoc sp. FACHB-110]|nr:DUF4157 domain-containing protein [Nostoc sp. FACHB-110]
MKLTIGQPGDKYEQEADRVAKDVVQRIHSTDNQVQQEKDSTIETAGQGQNFLSRMSIERLSLQPIPEPPRLQMKLSLREPGEEREPTLDQQTNTPVQPLIQRVNIGGMAASPDVESGIQSARGGGQPLADSIREPMEQAFGADFSGVRVHTDSQADQLNQSIQAKAFTTGQDVFFRQGAYEPGSRGGQELLAHELTHVVQQKKGVSKRKRKEKATNHSTQRSEVNEEEPKIHRKVSVEYNDQIVTYQIKGRPEFTDKLKREVYDNAFQDGEYYMTNLSDNNGKSFKLPTIHRRHRIAWSLWRETVNEILRYGDARGLESFMKRCFVSDFWKRWSKTEYEEAKTEGKYLVDMSKDFFNHPHNIWLGPGDENIEKGAGLDKLIEKYRRKGKGNPKLAEKLKKKAFDPRVMSNYEYRMRNEDMGEEGGWYSQDLKNLTPKSEKMLTLTEWAIKYLGKSVSSRSKV